MPIFDYVCPKCGHKEDDVLVKTGDRVKCTKDKCDTKMVKQICAPNIGGMDHNGSSGNGKLPF